MQRKNNKIKFILCVIFGVSTSIMPSVLLLYGIGQIHLLTVFGEEVVAQKFAISSGIVSLFAIFLGPLGGYISDKTRSSIGKRRFWIMIGSIVGFIGMLWFSFSSTLIEVVISWIVVSFSYGLVTLSYYALIPENFNVDCSEKIFGYLSAISPLVIMIFAIIIMGCFSSLSIPYKVHLIAIIQLVVNLLIIMLIKESKKNNEIKENRSHYLYPRFSKYPNFTWILLNKLCVNIVTAGLSMMTLFYISRFGLNEEEVFKISAISYLGVILMVASGVFSSNLSYRLDIKKVLIMLSLCIIGGCMFIYSISSSIILIVIISFFYHIAYGIFNSVSMMLVIYVLPSRNSYAKDIAIINATVNLSRVLVGFSTPMILSLGSIWMNDDGYTLFFIVLSFFSFLSLIFIIPITKEKNEPYSTSRKNNLTNSIK